MRPTVNASAFSRNKAIWRSRRGLLELDLYLTPFAKACFDHLSVELQHQYGELLECEDPEILIWLKDGANVPSEYEQIVEKIVEFARRSRGFDKSEQP